MHVRPLTECARHSVCSVNITGGCCCALSFGLEAAVVIAVAGSARDVADRAARGRCSSGAPGWLTC